MARTVELNPDHLKLIRTVDERLVSYNIEMTEVTGGTFWKAYTPGQIAGTEPFPPLSVSGLKDITAMSDLMAYYPPIHLEDQRLRSLARALGPAWIRVSGSWATKTYYDFEGVTGGKPPEGYQSVLTREQWIGVLDFVRAVGGKLLISLSNCAGDHPDGGLLDLTQTRKICAFSHAYGVDIDAVEFMNEPNMLAFSGAPAGYTPEDYARDQEIVFGYVRAHYPNCLLVGPCTTGDPSLSCSGERSLAAGLGRFVPICTTAELMAGTTIRPDVFSIIPITASLNAARRLRRAAIGRAAKRTQTPIWPSRRIVREIMRRCAINTRRAVRCGSRNPAMRAPVATHGRPPIWMCCER